MQKTHKVNFIANSNNAMLLPWIVFISALLLFLPIGVWCEGYYTKLDKRLFWNCNLYGFLHVIGGFLQFSTGKIWVYKNKKVKSVSFLTLFKENKARYDVAKGFHLSAISAVIESGNPTNATETLFFLQSVNSILIPIISVIRTKKNALRINITEIYASTENKFTLTARAVFWFTPLILGFSIIKHLLNERLKYAKRKQTI